MHVYLKLISGPSNVTVSDKAIPFFFVYCRMRFVILGWSVGKEKKNKKKIGKGIWN